MPYYRKLNINGRTYFVVHAGYLESLETIGGHFDSCEQFYLYVREESFRLGGVRHGTIIAGHTPTIVKESFAYNKLLVSDNACGFKNRGFQCRL